MKLKIGNAFFSFFLKSNFKLRKMFTGTNIKKKYLTICTELFESVFKINTSMRKTMKNEILNQNET